MCRAGSALPRSARSPKSGPRARRLRSWQAPRRARGWYGAIERCTRGARSSDADDSQPARRPTPPTRRARADRAAASRGEQVGRTRLRESRWPRVEDLDTAFRASERLRTRAPRRPRRHRVSRPRGRAGTVDRRLESRADRDRDHGTSDPRVGASPPRRARRCGSSTTTQSGRVCARAAPARLRRGHRRYRQDAPPPADSSARPPCRRRRGPMSPRRPPDAASARRPGTRRRGAADASARPAQATILRRRCSAYVSRASPSPGLTDARARPSGELPAAVDTRTRPAAAAHSSAAEPGGIRPRRGEVGGAARLAVHGGRDAELDSGQQRPGSPGAPRATRGSRRGRGRAGLLVAADPESRATSSAAPFLELLVARASAKAI